MNYYERHLGDYARDTGHLTMLEHGAYTLLLDRYYATETGIPADQAHRVARARTKEEKQAVDAVLSEFFSLQDGLWIKNRVQEEITKTQTKIKAAQENGKRGGRPKKNQAGTQEKPSGFSVGSENKTQVKAHHTPYTIHQTPDTNKTTQGGACCKAMIEAGISGCNPSHPILLALIGAGADEDEFRNASKAALEKGKPTFAYVIGIVKRQREDAAAIGLGNATPGRPEKFDPVAFVNNGTPQAEGGNGRVIEHAA